MIASLEKTSRNKTVSSRMLELRQETAAAKISLSYDAVRELLEAMALRKGFKIYNHVCYVAFLAEVLHSDLAQEFDELRIIRDDINYYGKEVSLDEAADVLARLQALQNLLLKLRA